MSTTPTDPAALTAATELLAAAGVISPDETTYIEQKITLAAPDPTPASTTPSPSSDTTNSTTPSPSSDTAIETGPVSVDAPCPICNGNTVVTTATPATPEATPNGPNGSPLIGGQTIQVCSGPCGNIVQTFAGDVTAAVAEIAAQLEAAQTTPTTTT